MVAIEILMNVAPDAVHFVRLHKLIVIIAIVLRPDVRDSFHEHAIHDVRLFQITRDIWLVYVLCLLHQVFA